MDRIESSERQVFRAKRRTAGKKRAFDRGFAVRMARVDYSVMPMDAYF
jgi:hypothetical protein